jgi:uncharacterized membrane protein YqgA involved in biofilm formation
MLGTLINAATVLVGSSLGLLLRTRLPQKVNTIVFQAIGLFTLFLGFSLALKVNNLLIMIFSLVLGALCGELLNLEQVIESWSERLKRRFATRQEKFTEGLLTAFLLFCMGSMTVLGAFEEGLGGKPNLLIAKAWLDGFSAIALSAVLGVGVLFAVIPLVLYQGALTLLAGLLHAVLSNSVINEMTAVGGVLLIGLGLNILTIKPIKVVNMLPALLIALLLAFVFQPK